MATAKSSYKKTSIKLGNAKTKPAKKPAEKTMTDDQVRRKLYGGEDKESSGKCPYCGK